MKLYAAFIICIQNYFVITGIIDVEVKMIYMDNAATTKTKKEVVDEMLKYFTILYGNPSSIYEFAGKSRDAIENARNIISDTINATSDEIYFTSGGTESDNWALRTVAKAYKNKGKHIITSKIEHPAILKTSKNLEDLDFKISYIDVDEYGVIKLQRLIDEITDETILVSVMMANNEIGTIEPISKIGKICHERGIIFHTDAVQAYGQIPIDVKKMNIDLLSASAHKFHGPKGIGFLYINDSVKTVPLLFGGGQEKGLRAGTQNVPSIVGMAKAAELSHNNMMNKARYEVSLRDYFIERILREIPFSRLNGSRRNRLPGNINISFQFVEASEILALLDMKGICASSGSACSSNSSKPSHVLISIGLPEELAYSSIRFTISDETTKDEIDFVVNNTKNIISELRKKSSEYNSYFTK